MRTRARKLVCVCARESNPRMLCFNAITVPSVVGGCKSLAENADTMQKPSNSETSCNALRTLIHAHLQTHSCFLSSECQAAWWVQHGLLP